jgi:polysaccharide pyruvyl transferase WcaK-like protein
MRPAAESKMKRRDFLKTLSLAGLGALAVPAFTTRAKAAPMPSILVRSSWQTVNIGDIGHTPGLLRLLETHLPDVPVTLWPCNVDRGVEPMLRQAFPRVQIVQGNLGPDGQPTTPELQAAFDRATLLLHGSGPSVVRHQDLALWREHVRKPYGIYGVTVGSVDDALRALLTDSRFVYCRDNISLDVVRQSGATPPVLEFAPDATFAFHLRDDAKAAAYLAAQGLEDGRFICAIPRLRYTPYHEIHGTAPTPEQLERAAYSAQHREPDHAKVRDALIAFVRLTGLKVLACPEMIHEVQLAKETLVDPLPDDVKPHVIWRDTYWLPDEAASVYARALAVVSFELHSPIMAVAAGTPAIYLRQPTDTSKGQMWRDLGLDEWIFEIEDTTGEQLAQTVMAIHADPAAARDYVEQAMAFVRQRQAESMAVVRGALA